MITLKVTSGLYSYNKFANNSSWTFFRGQVVGSSVEHIFVKWVDGDIAVDRYMLGTDGLTLADNTPRPRSLLDNVKLVNIGSGREQVQFIW